MQRTILGCSVLGLRLLKQEPLDIAQAVDESLTVVEAVDAEQQPPLDLTDDALIEVHTLLTTAYVASQTVEVGETQCLLPQHQAFYRAAMGLQFLPEVPLKQKAITLLLLQVILDDHENDTVFSFEPEARTKLQLIQRINVLHQALLKCVSKNQSLYLMWRVFNPDSHSKIVAFSEQDRNIDWMAYKSQPYEAIEAASHRRITEIDAATQALKVEFDHRKQAIRDHYAMMIAVECSKIDTDTADIKRAAKRQRKKDAIKLLVVTAASAGVAAGVGAALQSSMLAANAAANTAAAGAATATATTTVAATTTAGVAGAAVAAPTLTFTQTMVLGAVKGLTMSTVQAAITGDNVLKRALEGGVLGAAAAGVNCKLGATAQKFKGQAIQAATGASLQTAFHGGNLGQNVVVAVAANTVAHAVLPMDKVNDLTPLTQVSLRTAGHAGVMAATAAALNASPEARANIVIAAVAGMITPVAESTGQGVGEHVVAPRAQAVVFKQAPKAMKASESLTQGEYVLAEPLKTTPQQHFALKGTSQEMQQRFIELGWNERSRAAALNTLIPATHASHQPSDKLAAKPLLKLYDLRQTQAPMSRRSNASLNYEYVPDRGVIQGSEVVADIMLHPIDAMTDVRVGVVDCFNVGFGIPNQGSRFRNTARRQEMEDGYKLFWQFDRASKIQTLTAVGTVVAEAVIIARSAAVPLALEIRKKIYTGIESMYSSNVARKAADEAFRGGKYAGEIKGLRRQTPGQLRGGIKSQKENIYEHEQKLRDPKQACENRNWDSMHENWQKNLLRHWKEDIQRAANKVEIARRVLREKETSTQQTWRNALPGVGEVCKPVIGWEVVQQEHNLSDRERPRP